MVHRCRMRRPPRQADDDRHRVLRWIYECRELLRHSYTRLSIASATDLGSSCSQNLSTNQPAVLSSRSCRRSRSTFAASFFSHQPRLVCGVVPCTGHECQKQPSRKTATRSFEKTISGRDLVTPAMERSTSKERRRSTSRRRTRISIGVSRRRVLCIRRETDAELGRGVRWSAITPSYKPALLEEWRCVATDG